MTTEPRQAVICDAGPLIHLDELNSALLLSDFADVVVPDAVWEEVSRHRPTALTVPGLVVRRQSCKSPSAEVAALATLFTLHPGEAEALSLARELGGALFLTDDTAARLAARTLGITVHGSIGILVRAIRRHQKSKDEVITLLRDLPNKSSLFIRPSLLEEVIAEIARAPE